MVLIEADDPGAAQEVRQSIEQGGIGAVESVDRLVGVAHHEEVGIIGEQRGQQAELGRVDVLHLVDEEVTATPADGVGERSVAGQGVGTRHDEVVEVEQPPLAPFGLVVGIDLGHLLGRDAAAPPGPPGRLHVVLGLDQAGLGPPDLAIKRAQAARIGRGDVGQQAAPVRQQQRFGPLALGPVLAQQAQGGAVEGPGLHAGDSQRPEPGAQLVGRLAAEGGDQRAVGFDRALADPAGHPQREHPGLAGPGPGHHAEQGILGLDGHALGRRQAVGPGEGRPQLVLLHHHHHHLTVPNGCLQSGDRPAVSGACAGPDAARGAPSRGRSAPRSAGRRAARWPPRPRDKARSA